MSKLVSKCHGAEVEKRVYYIPFMRRIGHHPKDAIEYYCKKCGKPTAVEAKEESKEGEK